MPVCEACGDAVIITPKGSKCTFCLRLYNQIETVGLKGFDPFRVLQAVEIMGGLESMGVPLDRIVGVHICDDGFIVQFNNEVA